MSKTELQRKDRSTRAKRYQAALNDELEKDEADQSFWGQDFFQEEAADNDYEVEHVSEDVPDSDFDEEDDEDEDEEAEEEEREKPRKKALKPPGRVSAPRPKAAAKPRAAGSELSEEEDLAAEYDPDEEPEDEPGTTTAATAAEAEAEAGPSAGVGGEANGIRSEASASAAVQPAKKKVSASKKHVVPVYQAPSLRRSTLAKVEMAENMREWKEQERQEQRPRKRKAKDDGWRPMTQQELLADAARTEVENTASLKLLLAMEAETKRRAAIVKKHYVGPSVKFHSVKVNDGERTFLRVVNMLYPPPWLRRTKAPPPAPRPHCLVTGLPARYRDPHTGQHFSSVGALKRLRGGGSVAPPVAGFGSTGAFGAAPVFGAGLFPPSPLVLPASSSVPADLPSALGSPKGAGAAGLASPRDSSRTTTTYVDRTVPGLRTQQARSELALADQALAPLAAYELPLEQMALVMDLRARLGQQMGLA